MNLSAISRVTAGASIAMAVFMLVACDGAFDNSDSNTKVNGSVHIAAGTPAADAKTVNGSIKVDDGAAITDAATVNGSIKLGANATGNSLKAVNGGIELGSNAKAGGITSVNGDLSLHDGAELSGALTNVNGKISLTAAHVAGLITTVNGNINIMGASRVDGGILVKKPGGTILIGSDSEPPTVVIGPGATVSGELRFERKVNLFVSDHATIGTVTGATAQTFSGDTPPHS
jgi:cytoskeletal protein CcmA (bactofilin family)